jgi:hypothetical protein
VAAAHQDIACGADVKSFKRQRAHELPEMAVVVADEFDKTRWNLLAIEFQVEGMFCGLQVN